MTGMGTLQVGGEPVRLYVAEAAGQDAPGIALYHAWWGLNDDVIAYADRLADAGYAVLAPDMFDGQVATEIEDAERLSSDGDTGADRIALAATDRLAGLLRADAPLGILGFSFGAAYAIWAPSERDRLVATVAYYGTYTGPFIARSHAPLLGHFAENDPYELDENVQELEAAFAAAGRDSLIHRYPGTGHWFAEPSRDAYRADAAELAFRRTLDFLEARLTEPA
jgi:carboxymethylenebutenolidase